MERVVVLGVLGLVLSAGAVADTCIRTTVHTDGYYQGGGVEPPEDREVVQWFGEGRMAVLTNGWRLVCDTGKNRVLLINTKDKSHVETACPLDLAKVIPAQEAPLVKMYQTQGTVSETAEKKTVAGKECRRWNLAKWIIYEGQRYNETEETAWFATDLPFKLDAYNALRLQLAALENDSPEYAAALQKIPGLPWAVESVRYTEGIAIRGSRRVVEIIEKEPPAGVYDVPEGSTKKENFHAREIMR